MADVAVTIRYWAAARAAAGRAEEHATEPDVAAALASAAERHGPGLARVLAVSSVLVDGTRRDRDDATPLPDGAVVEVLPPFAGG